MDYNNDIELEKNSKMFVIIVIFLIFIVIIIGLSFATITYTKEGTYTNSISTGNISLSFTENTNGISITNAYPMTDDAGKVSMDDNYYFDFSVNNIVSGDVATNYEISALKDNMSTLDNNEVRLYLEKEKNGKYVEVMEPSYYLPIKETTKLGTEVGSMILDNATLKRTTVVKYRLRMWVAENAIIDSNSRSFSIKVSIKAKVDLDV